MELQDEKKQIANILNELVGNKKLRKHDKIFQGCLELQRDMAGDFYTVVVLGEFKRGKSTLVNALLGTNLLPMNVLPETATINAIMYEEKPRLCVVQRDGTHIQGDVSREFLQQYSAREEENAADNVSYIKIGYPCDMLKDRVVLVDTPGVSDINEQRSEVTYRFLPKANAVIFVLDANSPLKKTEKEFIEEKLLPLGINNILFVLNKYDAVDEEEEEDFLPTVRNRLFKMDEENARLRDISIIPFSAKWALDGLEKGNDKMVRLSGLPQMKEKLASMLMESQVEKEKVIGYRHRLVWLLSAFERDMEREYALSSSSVEDLEKATEVLHKAVGDKAEKKEKVEEYVKSAKVQMFAMADKSLRHFHDKLKENIFELVEQYHSQDFKHFVEDTIPRQVKREVESWLTRYSSHLDRILGSMEQEMAKGFSRHFEQQVKLQAKKESFLRCENLGLRLEATDISQTANQAGIITAVGMVFTSLVITPVITPFFTMWGRTKILDRLLGKKLEEAKAEIRPQLEGELVRTMVLLTSQVHKYIDKRANNIKENAESAYEILVDDMAKEIEKQLAKKNKEGEIIRQEMAALSEEMNMVRVYRESLQAEGEML